MSFAQRMQDLFDATPGCRALVLGDLEAGTVLRACAAPGQRQEHHDALVAEAAALFDPALDECVLDATGWTTPPTLALRLDRMEARLFAVNLEDGVDVVCARADPDAALDPLQSGLRALLDHDA